MSELWKQWTGRNVAGKFTLESYLGGSDHSAVFLTTQSTASGSDKAAIKLIAADRFAADSGAEKQLARWNSIREWNHPNLIRIFEAGRCDLDGTQLLYVVEEYAEENLAQILPERALTAEETRGMLPPVLQALKFVHNKGFVHGSIQPANILAIGDDVKLSTDSLHVAGEKVDPAGAPRAIDPPEATTGLLRRRAMFGSWNDDRRRTDATLTCLGSDILGSHIGKDARSACGSAGTVPGDCRELFANRPWEALDGRTDCQSPGAGTHCSSGRTTKSARNESRGVKNSAAENNATVVRATIVGPTVLGVGFVRPEIFGQVALCCSSGGSGCCVDRVRGTA